MADNSSCIYLIEEKSTQGNNSQKTAQIMENGINEYRTNDRINLEARIAAPENETRQKNQGNRQKKNNAS